MSENINFMTILFGLFGGLTLFIYGMNLMGDGLQKAAGDRLRNIINTLTSNPLLAVLVGTVVTAIIQSSSATTVIVVGLVSAKLMTLHQAIGVIMGANIGTTVTAQLIAIDIGEYAYPIAAAGFILYFFIKKKIVKYTGQTVFGFGVLFIGLNIMGDSMRPLVEFPLFINMIEKMSEYPILGLLTGTVFTMIIQSSSASIGVLQELASKPIHPGSTQALINLQAALPVILGCKIGTTITALLASIGVRINAKRAALAHTVFNIFGSVILMFFIPAYADFIRYISIKGPEVDIIKSQIANAHTLFSIINTLICIPFTGLLAKIVTLLIPGEDDGLERRTFYLDRKMLGSPSIAMDLAMKELARMADHAQDMMNNARDAFIKMDMKAVEKVMELEEVVDMLQDEIVKYLASMLSQGSLTEHQSTRLAGLMHVTNDIERMGDHCQNIAEFGQIRQNENMPFSDEAISEVSYAFEQVGEMVNNSIKALRNNNPDLALLVTSKESEIDAMEEKLREQHVKRLHGKLCDPQAAIIFAELIHNLERIADHCNNIAEAVIEGS